MHLDSMKLMKYFRNKYLDDNRHATILDVGSRRVKRSHQSYKRVFRPPFQYIGMDIEPGRNVDIVGWDNLHGTFDVVISGQVLEHVRHPWDWLKFVKKYFTEYICIIAPNHRPEHRYPIDTYRYFPDGMRALFEYVGIKELEIFKYNKDTIGIGTKE